MPDIMIESYAGNTKQSYFDDGNWHATTLGNFVSLLVDAGIDVAVTFRVVEDGPEDEDGQFFRTYEATIWPNGQVGEAILGCQTIHRMLKALLEVGIIK